MICFVLLLATLSIINASTTPIERNRLAYYKYPEGITENYQKYNYYGRPKNAYELILQPQSYTSKRNDVNDTLDDLLGGIETGLNSMPNIESLFPTEGPMLSPGYYKTTNVRSTDDVYGTKTKKSPTPQELRQKLVTLGADYMEVMHTFVALYESKQV